MVQSEVILLLDVDHRHHEVELLLVVLVLLVPQGLQAEVQVLEGVVYVALGLLNHHYLINIILLQQDVQVHILILLQEGEVEDLELLLDLAGEKKVLLQDLLEEGFLLYYQLLPEHVDLLVEPIDPFEELESDLVGVLGVVISVGFVGYLERDDLLGEFGLDGGVGVDESLALEESEFQGVLVVLVEVDVGLFVFFEGLLHLREGVFDGALEVLDAAAGGVYRVS